MHARYFRSAHLSNTLSHDNVYWISQLDCTTSPSELSPLKQSGAFNSSPPNLYSCSSDHLSVYFTSLKSALATWSSLPMRNVSEYFYVTCKVNPRDFRPKDLLCQRKEQLQFLQTLIHENPVQKRWYGHGVLNCSPSKTFPWLSPQKVYRSFQNISPAFPLSYSRALPSISNFSLQSLFPIVPRPHKQSPSVHMETGPNIIKN